MTTTTAMSLAEPLLKADEAAVLLSVKPSWIYEAVRAGALPCLKVGRHIRFTRPMLEKSGSRRAPSRRAATRKRGRSVGAL